MAPEQKLKEAIHLSLVPGRAKDALQLAVLAAEASKGEESGELQRDAMLLQAECELSLSLSSSSSSSGWEARVNAHLDAVEALMPNGVAAVPDSQEMARLRATRAMAMAAAAATSSSSSSSQTHSHSHAILASSVVAKAARGMLEPYGDAPKPMSTLTGDDFFALGRAWAALGDVDVGGCTS
jgi:hypothetical protein